MTSSGTWELLAHLGWGVLEPTSGGGLSAELCLEQELSPLQQSLLPDVARRRALVAVSTMIGALTMSRIATDPALSGEILRSAEESMAHG